MSLKAQPSTGTVDTEFGWQLFESSPDCIKLLSNDGRIRAMNRNGMCLMEIERFDTIAGAPWKSFWPQDSHADIDRALASAVEGGTGHFIACCPTAKGNPKWWDVTITRIAGPGQDGDSLLALSRDITATREADRALRASEARFRSLVAATSAIVWTRCSSGRFDTEQPAWAAFTGQSFDQYRGEGWLDAVHPDDRDATRVAWERAGAARAIYQVDHRLRRATACIAG